MIRHAILEGKSPIRNDEALHFRLSEKFGSDYTANSAEHTFPQVISRPIQPGTSTVCRFLVITQEYRCCAAVQQYEPPPQASGHKTAVRLYSVPMSESHRGERYVHPPPVPLHSKTRGPPPTSTERREDNVQSTAVATPSQCLCSANDYADDQPTAMATLRQRLWQRSVDDYGDYQPTAIPTLSQPAMPTISQRLCSRSVNGYRDDQQTAMPTLSQRLWRPSVNGHTVARRRKNKKHGHHNQCIQSTHTPPHRSRQGLLFSTYTIALQNTPGNKKTTTKMPTKNRFRDSLGKIFWGAAGGGGGETGCQQRKTSRKKPTDPPKN